MNLNLITCEDKIVILSITQGYVSHCYHTYLINPGMDRREELICRNFYWTVIRSAIQKEVTNCNTCQITKKSKKKDGKLPDKEAE